MIEAERDLRPGVVAALDADDDRKRDLIGQLVDRPLAHIFREFAALRGSALYGLLRDGDLCYLGFVLACTRGARGPTGSVRRLRGWRDLREGSPGSIRSYG